MSHPISESQPPESQIGGGGKGLLSWLGVFALIYLLIVAVGTIGTGFKAATGERAEELFAFATNPFLGLIVSGIAMIILGIVLIFVSILYVGKLLKSLMVGRA